LLDQELELAPPVAFSLAWRTPVHDAALHLDSTIGDVARAALARSAELILHYHEQLRFNPDETTVHQARVSVRRLRSDLRAFFPLLDAEWAGDLRARLSWLQDGLSAARDADVLIAALQQQSERLPEADRRHLDALLAPFVAARRAACERVQQMLHEEAYATLLHAIVEAANSPPLTPLAAEPARSAIPSIIEGAWSTLRKRVRRRSRPATDHDLHRIRIAAKRLRYTAEALEPVAGRAAHALARKAATIQTILGNQHDAVVACRRLGELATSEYAYLAGELAALERAEGLAARAVWRAAWRKAKRAHRTFLA
jgi:CHAD domain-containing protein